MATALLARWEGLQMRRSNRLTTPLALCAATALLLAGCTGDGGNGGTGDDESPSPTTSQSSSTSGSESHGGGSSESGSESASPTGSATPEPATSTSPAKNIPAPEMPDAMKKNDQAGLEAALEYWFETEYYLKSTGDAEPMKQVSMDDCILCNAVMDDWPPVYDAGGWVVSEPNEIGDVLSNVDNGGTGGTYLFTVTSKPSQVYRPSGEPVADASSSGHNDYPWSGSAYFDSEAGHWKIENVAAQE